MELRLTDWMTNLLGVQSVAQFGAQPQTGGQDILDADCSALFTTSPNAVGSSAVASVKNHLAVIPNDWTAGGVSESTRSHGRCWY